MAVLSSNYELNPFAPSFGVAANNQSTTGPATQPLNTAAPSRRREGPVPWGLHPMPKWIEKELIRRSREYGQNPSEQISTYSGPRTAWVRVCSNGISAHPLAAGKDGFVLGGIHGFNDSYGFNSSGTIKIGTDVHGNYHELPIDTSYTIGLDGNTKRTPDFPHRPPPAIESLSCELNGANTGFPNLCRKATIRWKCNSLSQLNYLLPYFFTPRISCVFEWGWNYYDTISLVDLTDKEWIAEMFTIPERSLDWIRRSNGNYDVAVGQIFDYGFKLNELGGYDCYTTIINANKMIEGASTSNRKVTVVSGKEDIPLLDMPKFAEKYLMSIDSNDPYYVSLRKDLGLENFGNPPINDRVFRITQSASPKNTVTEDSKLWLRMDLVQDIINAFYKGKAGDPLESPINEFYIKNAIISANRFMKSVNKNVLVPNQYAPRLTTNTEKNQPGESQLEDSTYRDLFKEKMSAVTQQQNLTNKIDDLRELINPRGRSFPVYEKLLDSVGPGDWGYLSDLFFNAYTLKQIILRNDTLLRLIEEILQTINESLCQVCQLKLVPSEYSNGLFSVLDNNMPGVTGNSATNNLVKIRLGALGSAFLKNVQFEVKTTSEMQGQIVFQSANLVRENGDTNVKNITANPLKFQYSQGDRIFSKINLDKKKLAPIATTNTSTVTIGQPAQNAIGQQINTPSSTNQNLQPTGEGVAAVNQPTDQPAGAPIPNAANAAVAPYADRGGLRGAGAEDTTGTNTTSTNNTNTSATAVTTVTNTTNAPARPESPPTSDDRPARKESNSNDFFMYYKEVGIDLRILKDGVVPGVNPIGPEVPGVNPTEPEPVSSQPQPVLGITLGQDLFGMPELDQPITVPSVPNIFELGGRSSAVNTVNTSNTNSAERETISYILYEKNKDFMRNILFKPEVKTSYGTGNIMPGTTMTLEFSGISGINYLSQFVIDHAPETYNYLNAVWQVDDIKHEVSEKNWTTTVIAAVRPLTEARVVRTQRQ